MKRVIAIVVSILFAAALPSSPLTSAGSRAHAMPAWAGTKPAVSAAERLTVHTSPARININRDVKVTIRVTDRQGKLVPGALLSLTGAGRPALSTAPHGTVTLKVHATALGTATLTASKAGFTSATVKLPIVPGPPASIVAFKRGITVLAPKKKPAAGKVGQDLLAQYHAITKANQFASLGLRDGTLVDLNSATDVLVHDPLHTKLNGGEIFLEVVHGAGSHQVQVGSTVAATKGTRLDVRYNAKSKAAVVIVVEGKVQVSNRGKSVLVGAGAQTTILNNRPPSPPVPANLAAQLSWLKSVPNSSSGAVVPPVLSLPVPPIVPVPVPPIAPTPTMTITSALESVAWSGAVLVTESVAIPAGTTVNIAPGTIVEMGNNAALNVKGTLSARGTAAAPIVFTSAAAQPAPNDWDYIDFDSPSASASVLDQVHVFYGGYQGISGAEVSASNGASPTISNCVIAYSDGDGLYLDDNSQAAVTDCVFAQNGSFAITTTANDASRISGSRLGPNQSKGIEVLGESVTQSGTWHRQDVPFAFDSGVKVAAGTRIDIEAGTVILMNNNASLSVAGTLRAQGTATAPIIFTSAAAQPAPNDWDYIDFTGTGASGSLLDHVMVFYGGYQGTGGAEVSVSNGASPTISNSAIEQSDGAGLYMDDGSRAVVTNCAFANNGGYAISTSADNASLITGITAAAGQTGIEVRSGDITHAGTWQAPTVPFQLNSGVKLDSAVTLHIAPGTLILMNNNASLSVAGTLLAQGTPSAPIIVSSAAAQPAPNDWDYIDFTGPSANGSKLDYVNVSYGGYTGTDSAEVSASNGAGPSFSNSIFAFSDGDGLYLDDGDRAVVTNCAFANNGGFAISASADNVALITATASAAGQKGIEVRPATISHSGTWEAQNTPLQLDSGVIVGQGTTITIQPGAMLEMLNNGSLSVHGTLIARGIAGAPIVFTSAAATPAPNDWDYIDFVGPGAGGVLDYVYVLYGGYTGSGGAEVSAESGTAPTITHCVIAYSSGDGIYVDDGSLATVANNSFHDNGGYAISLPAKDPTHVHDNVFVGRQQGMEIRS